MTDRIPLVFVDSQVQELPAADTLNVVGKATFADQVGFGTAPSSDPRVAVTIRKDAVDANAAWFASITFQNLTTGSTEGVFQEAFAFQTVVSGALSDTWACQHDPLHERKEIMTWRYRGQLVMQAGRNAVANQVLSDYGVTFFTKLYSQGNFPNFVAETTTANSNASYRLDSNTIPGSGGKIWDLQLRGADLGGAFVLRDISRNVDVITVDPSTGQTKFGAALQTQTGSLPQLLMERLDAGNVTVEWKNPSARWQQSIRSDLSNAWTLRDVTNNVDKLIIRQGTAGVVQFDSPLKALTGASPAALFENPANANTLAEWKNTAQRWQAGIRTDVSQAWLVRDVTNGVDAFWILPSTGQTVLGSSLRLKSYTVANAPSAATAGAGSVIYCSNGNAGQPCLAVSNGTNWKVVALGATISAS